MENERKEEEEGKKEIDAARPAKPPWTLTFVFENDVTFRGAHKETNNEEVAGPTGTENEKRLRTQANINNG